MIRYIQIALATILMTFVAIQSSEAQAKFGFRAGVNITKQEFKSGSVTVEPKSKFGLDLALVADLPLGEVVSISPELHWLQKGYKLEDISGSLGDISGTFNYLELPVLVKFNFGEAANFNVFAGPSVGYIIDGNIDNNGVDEDPDYDLINRLELGAHLGAGIGLGPVNIDVRYLLGLSNFAKDDPNIDEIKNTGFGAGVSVMF